MTQRRPAVARRSDLAVLCALSSLCSLVSLYLMFISALWRLVGSQLPAPSTHTATGVRTQEEGLQVRLALPLGSTSVLWGGRHRAYMQHGSWITLRWLHFESSTSFNFK